VRGIGASLLEAYYTRYWLRVSKRTGPVAESVLDRTGHKQREKVKLESRRTIDVRTLSTPLLRQIAAELRQQEARNHAPSTPGPPADDRPED
jgi:hypothetical protein